MNIMAGASDAVTQATRLNEIGFPEFTTKLITDVFDSLVSSNLRQTEAYIELLKETSKTLTQFINDTKDDISGEMVLDFLTRVMPATSNKQGEVLVKESNGNVKLDQAQADALNNALVLPAAAATEGDAANNAIAKVGDSNKYDAILEAVAKRIAATNHELLQEMVKQGILRLVVENGQIETRLSFKTYGYSRSQDATSKYDRESYSKNTHAGTGRFISLWAKASTSTRRNSVSVSTASASDVSSSSSSVDIFGGVKLNFKTDYLSLDR